MPRTSAGLLFFRRQADGIEVLLVHPGGPFWARKDDGAWSIPKGEIEPGEDPLAAARREVAEETGFDAAGPVLELGRVTQGGGKIVLAWALERDADPTALRSNRFTLELPKGSGRMVEFPEVDRAAWFGLAEARRKILSGQRELLDRLEAALR